MSVIYYRALGPPQVWVETVGRGGGGGSWWLGGENAGSVDVGGSMARHTARNLGSVGGGWSSKIRIVEQQTWQNITPPLRPCAALSATLACCTY